MQERVPHLVRDFLPQVPEGIVTTTGEERPIFEKWDVFFNEVMNYLGITKPARLAFVEIKNFAFRLSDDREREVEDEAMFLIVMDLPVASVTTIKNENNFVQGLFASYLTPEWEDKVRRRLRNPSDATILYLDDPKEEHSQDLLVAPESFIANIDAVELEQGKKAYLDEVIEGLGFTPKDAKGVAEIKTRRPYDINSEGEEIPTDDKEEVLYVRGVPSAIVLETITEQGLIRFNASLLTREAERGLKKMPGKE